MVYNRKKIVAFGGAGIVIALILILAFIPAQKKIGINPTVALQEIPKYGFQIVKISEEQADIFHLNVTFDGFEIMQSNGDWAEIDIPVGSISFNLLRDRVVSFIADIGGLDAGNYTAIRFQVIQGLEFTNVTLNNGDLISVDVPNVKVEFTTPSFEIIEGTERILFDLRTGSGSLSNYMLPQFHLAIGTIKIEITVS